MSHSKGDAERLLENKLLQEILDTLEKTLWKPL